MKKPQPLKVIAGAPEHPLRIGKLELQCYVLEDKTRVLNRTSVLRAIGRTSKAKGGRRYDQEFKLPVFLTAKNLEPFISNDLGENSKPILFQYKGKQQIGYRADFLPQICEIFIDASAAGVLHETQTHIAAACRILHRGFARIGIIGLIDEATGYQEIRDRQTLQEILDKYLLAERAKWAKRFPDPFYQEIFRLRGWEWRGMKVNRPQVVGHYTNDIVWDRLAPGVRDELERLNPKQPSGQREAKHHQWLTQDIGHPTLEQHLIGVMAIMRGALKWEDFKRALQRSYPKINVNLDLPFEED